MDNFGPRFVPTFLYYFVSTSAIALFVLSRGLGSQLDVAPSQVAIALGVVAGALGGYNNSTDTLEIPVKNKGGFAKNLQEMLHSAGYTAVDQLDEFTVYQRAFPSRLFSGKVYVNITKDRALISGRANLIRRLKKALLQ